MVLSRLCDLCGAENPPEKTACFACQQPLVLSSETLLNGRYTLLHEIGEGGFGAVYKAQDRQENGRLVAIKQINLEKLNPQEIIEATDAFNRELEILSVLSHPLLPHIFEHFSDPGHWYLVMTFIEGITLDDYMQQRKAGSSSAFPGLPLHETLAIALQLCDALHFLHTQHPPVIYRDLKPGNIMRTPEGNLYLIDFGIARRFKPGQAKDTIPFGSPGFAAPEQYGRAQTTPQADIYSLGALISFLISGDDPSEHPFDFPVLRRYGVDGIRELDALVQRMVVLDAAQRPASIREVQTELQSVKCIYEQAHRPPVLWTPPQSQTPPQVGSKQYRVFLKQLKKQTLHHQTRRATRRSVLTVSLLIGGLAFFGGVSMFAQDQQDQPYSSGVDVNSGTSNTDGMAYTYWSDDLSLSATFGSAGQVYIHASQGDTLIQTLLTPISSVDLQWSPDNSQILVFTGDAGGDVWDVQSGAMLFTVTPEISIIATNPMAAAWSPDGKYLAVGVSNQKNSIFTLFDVKSEKQLFQQILEGQAATSLAWTVDSRLIVFPVSLNPGSSASTWALEVWDSKTQQQISVITDLSSIDLSTANSLSLLTISSITDQVAFVYDMSIWLGNLQTPGSFHQFVDLSPLFPSYGDAVNLRLSWSPDERYLAFLRSSTLKVWKVANGKLATLGSNFSQGYVDSFSWTIDSQSVIVVDDHNGLTAVSVR